MENFFLIQIRENGQEKFKLIDRETYKWLKTVKPISKCPKNIAKKIWKEHKNGLLNEFNDLIEFINNLENVNISGNFLYDMAILAPTAKGKMFFSKQEAFSYIKNNEISLIGGFDIQDFAC